MNTKEEVRDLWRTCFEDSEAFIDLYFSLRYNEEINRMIVKEGRVVSALQAIPYPMTCYGKTVEMAYISGACTHPDYRERGVMRQLLKESHRRMYEEGVEISTLIPAEEWLKGYYAKSGYITSFYYGQSNVSSSSLGFDTSYKVEVCTGMEEDVIAYFQKKMGERRTCVQHTLEDYKVILADWHLGKGMVLAAYRNGKLVGIAFCVEENNDAYVKEALYETQMARDMLFRKVLSLYSMNSLEYMYPSDMPTVELGMARIVSVKKMLDLYAETHPGETLCCYVYGDEAIPENNGYYTLDRGVCREVQRPDIVYEEHTIGSLTKRLFQNEQPYMSLMLN